MRASTIVRASAIVAGLALLFGFGCADPAPLPPASFASGTLTPAPAHPNYVTTGDVDGDGFVDLAVAGTVAGEIWIYRGDGQGGLVPPTGSWRIAVTQATHVLLVDLDGSPPDEIVAPLPAAAGLAVWGSDGKGGIRELARHTGIGDLPSYIAVADVDGDGSADAVVSDMRGDGLLLLRAILEPGGSPELIAAANGPQEVVLADVTGDGILDLLAAVAFEDRVAVLAGDGAGGFLEVSSVPTDSYPISVSAVDVDGDGALEIVSAAHLAGTLVVADDPSPGSGAWSVTTRPSCLQPIALRWVGGSDGEAPDLYHACKGESAVAGHLLGASSVKAPPTMALIATVQDPGGIALADLDDDGVLDLVTVSSTFDLLEVRRGLR